LGLPVKRNDFKAAATHPLPYDLVAKKRLSGSKRGAGMISSALDIAGNDQTPAIGPSATDSLERRGKMTSVSAKETVPQPDANHAEQKWDLGGSRIFIRRYSLWSSCYLYEWCW
jgi:hypothetical protein